MRYLDEKAREEQYHDLQREMAKNRSLAQRPRSRLSRSGHVADKLGVLRLHPGARLKQFEQAQLVLEKHE
jgi:hypothetical protein